MSIVAILLTVFEAAELLAVKPATLRKWIYQRRIGSVRLGRAVRLKRTDVEALIRRGDRPAITTIDGTADGGGGGSAA